MNTYKTRLFFLNNYFLAGLALALRFTMVGFEFFSDSGVSGILSDKSSFLTFSSFPEFLSSSKSTVLPLHALRLGNLISRSILVSFCLPIRFVLISGLLAISESSVLLFPLDSSDDLFVFKFFFCVACLFPRLLLFVCLSIFSELSSTTSSKSCPSVDC